MIKSFLYSFIIAAVFITALISGESIFFTNAKEDSNNEVAQIKNGSVSLASEESSSDSDTEDYTLLLGKDGSVVNSSQIVVTQTIYDSNNYSYQY